MALRKDYQLVSPKDRAEWRAWLQKNHTQKEGIWLIIPKKGNIESSLTRQDLVEEALCFGWIDSVPGLIDAQWYKLLISPRKPKSNWSKVNKGYIKHLIKDGLMHVSGLAKINLAKKTGTWTALNNIDKLIYPVDLNKAFSKNKKAKTYFDAFPPSAKKRILDWIQSAKTEETKSKRIKETVSNAERNIRANQYVKKRP